MAWPEGEREVREEAARVPWRSCSGVAAREKTRARREGGSVREEKASSSEP